MSTRFQPHPWLTIAPDRVEPDRTDWQQIESHNMQLLCRALASQTTIAFAGAGVSLAYGLPLWGELYQRMFDRLKADVNDLPQTLSSPMKRLADLNSRNRKRKKRALAAGGHMDIDLPSAFQLLESAASAHGQQQSEPPPARIPTDVQARIMKRWQFTSTLKDAIGQAKSLAPANDPCLSLLELPIRRFVTTNYDGELERAIRNARGVDPGRSFTQRDQSKMPRFSVALAPGNHYMVFHCHGSLDSLQSRWPEAGQPPDDIVITEDDYKFWYLAESPAASGFRLLLDVILLSSPILFVGYGLGDPDLLRALRLLSINREQSKPNSSIFALVRESSTTDSELQFRALQNRYGLNVIGIPVPKPQDIATRLLELKQTFLRERLEWRMQPRGRRLKPDPVRYALQPQNDNDPLFAKPCVEADPLFDLLVEFLQDDKKSVLLLHGDIGAGKYVRVSQLLHAKDVYQHAVARDFEYVFFSSHDTDDLYLYLKKIVLAVEGIAFDHGPTPARASGLIERLKAALTAARKPICVIISGLDRFIHWIHEREVPLKPNKLTTELLDFLDSSRETLKNGKVIVTTRFKLTTGPDELAHATTKLPLSYANELAGGFGITDGVPKVLRMVNGHYSSFVIALAWLATLRPGKEREMALGDMVDRLAGALSERSSRLVGYVIRRISPTFAKPGVPIEFLEQLLVCLSCFTRPFNAIVAARVCGHVNPSAGYQGTMDELLRFRLVEIVNPVKDEALYVVSPIVRQYCRSRRLKATVVEVRSFGLHGYTSRGNYVDSGSSPIPGTLFSELTRQAKAEVLAFRRNRASVNITDPAQVHDLGHVARSLVRASFDVLRSNFACNSTPRWGTFGAYARMCAECFDLVKNYCITSGDCWQPDLGALDCVGETGPLTPEEIVWLLNEMGLSYYGEGAVQDAVAVWGLAFEWQQSLRQEDQDQADMYSASLLCHLGAANLQLGRLEVARSHFERANEYARQSGNRDLQVRVRGFLARVEHFRGSVRRADTEYRAVLRELDVTGNKRAQSYFMRHRAALHVRQGDFERAERLIRESMVLAAAENYPDFVAYSRELLARLMIRRGRTDEAAREYRLALAEARRMGMYRLEADVLLGLARVQLELGDATVARRRALESLKIANQQVLALRQDRALVVLGRAHIKLGEVEAGKEFLRLARELASSHEFRLIQHEAEEELSKLGAAAEVL